jgi:hypothetical protein
MDLKDGWPRSAPALPPKDGWPRSARALPALCPRSAHRSAHRSAPAPLCPLPHTAAVHRAAIMRFQLAIHPVEPRIPTPLEKEHVRVNRDKCP